MVNDQSVMVVVVMELGRRRVPGIHSCGRSVVHLVHKVIVLLGGAAGQVHVVVVMVLKVLQVVLKK